MRAALRHLASLGYAHFKVVGQDPFNVRHPVTWMGQGSGPFGDWAQDLSLEARGSADILDTRERSRLESSFV